MLGTVCTEHLNGHRDVDYVQLNAVNAVRGLEDFDDEPDIPHFEGVVKAAFGVLEANYDDQMEAIAPGSIQNIGFQHIKVVDALLAAQAIAHRNFTQATKQFKTILKHQWYNGFMPDVIYGPSVGVSSTWLPTNKTYYPGPAFWSSNENVEATPTSGILASPIHAETAMRIFYLAPLDTSMGTPVYTDNAMTFLCDVYSPLHLFHKYLFLSRQATNESLLTLRHPWESVVPVAPGWKDALAKIKQAADYSQVIQRLSVPSNAQEAFVAASALFYPDTTSSVKDIYEPMLYLASCFVQQRYNDSKIHDKCAMNFEVLDVEFNSIVLRSLESLLNMATLLAKHSARSLRFDCNDGKGIPKEEEIDALKATVAALKAKLQASYPSGLWNTSTQFSDNSIQMSLLSHILPTPKVFNYFCDYYPMGIYPCDSSESNPNIVLIVQNYLIYRGFLKNSFLGIAQVLLQKTFKLFSLHGAYQFGDVFDATSGAPLTTSTGLTSTLAASVAINIGLPDATQPPSPDTPPINRKMILIVMCIELVVAMGVAIACVVFSVYFVVKRPQQNLRASSSSSTSNGKPHQSEAKSHHSPSSDQLEESLLSEEEEVDEYGSFLDTSPNGGRQPKGTWSSIRSFVASISPWG
ncbi:hypothetical protein THRCLA_05346 [Thraustotheca clavata]|uniref:Mannosylglycerate hydrolase MGH1-like glycoside hydrolase domain-containing protein n=1 Tax=Thraustotheca clavata TaxID=74557 RepID=A0A1V9ZW85_9STRA|nr:hypothetical protein THRCLA_05346 [Thraustotheca clavata]